jgi:hypothetical protein
LESKGQEKEKELSKLRELLSELKREKDRLRYENMTLK